MAWKSSLAMVVCLFFCQISLGDVPTNTAPTVRVGDSVLLELTGKPAISILRLSDSSGYESVKNGNVKFDLHLEAKVISIEESGEVLVQYQSNANLATKDPLVVTVAARVDSCQIEPASINIGSISSPQPQRIPTEIERQALETQARQARLPKVHLDSMKGLHLRAWKMVEVEKVTD